MIDFKFYQKRFTRDVYTKMLTDTKRNFFYKRIIKDYKPKKILDFGCGIPILSYYALLSGAEKVYAVDGNKDVIPILEEFKKKFGDRFEYFITDHNNLPDIEIDCVVSELFAPNMFHENVITIYESIKNKYINQNIAWLPSQWKLSIALCNKKNIEKNVEYVLGAQDDFDFISDKWQKSQGYTHQKFMLPINQKDFSFETTEWKSFPTFNELKWNFNFIMDYEQDVDLVYIKFVLGHKNHTLDINKSTHTDHWGNQFITLKPRKVKGKVSVCISLDRDKKSIKADWI